MLVLQPSAASMDTESHESWLELRDSTLFSSSREEEEEDEEEAMEACEEEEELLLPLDDPWPCARLPLASSIRAVSRQSSLSLLRWRMESRLRITQPRVCEW